MDRSRTLLWIRDRISGGLETRNSWPNAVLAEALMDSDDRYRVEIGRYLNELFDEEGTWVEDPKLLSHCMVGIPLLRWQEQTGDARFQKAAGNLVEWLLDAHVRSPTGTLPYRPEEPDVLLVDSLGMICPLLARYGVEREMQKAVELAKLQLFEFLEHGMDPVSGLPFHAYQITSSGEGHAFGLAGWGRGAGWLALGLAGTISWLPENDLDRRRLEEAFEQLMHAVARYQKADGLWGWALNIPGADLDTSATGMLALATRIGIEQKLLDQGIFQDVREMAVRGILKNTSSKGVVGQSMADAAGIGRYPWFFTHTTWAQGYALLAVGEISLE